MKKIKIVGLLLFIVGLAACNMQSQVDEVSSAEEARSRNSVDNQYVKIEANTNQFTLRRFPEEPLVLKGSNVKFDTMIAISSPVEKLDAIFVNGKQVDVPFYGDFILEYVQEDTVVDFIYSPYESVPVIAEYTIEQDWGTGFTAVIDIVNYKEHEVSNWWVEMDYGGHSVEITSVWDCSLLDYNNKVILKCAEWNNSIKPGEKVRVRLNGKYIGENKIPSTQVLLLN